MRTVLAVFIDAKCTVAFDPLVGFAKRRARPGVSSPTPE